MRLTMPIGAPGAPGPVNRLLLGAQGSYTVSGQAATLTYAQTGTFIMPTAANTGDQSGVTRTTYTGTRNISVAGTVISHFNINGASGSFVVSANNVTFQYCRFTNPQDYFTIDAESASGLKILDCEFTGPYITGLNAPVLTGDNAEVRRCNISGYDNGLTLNSGTQTIVGNYIHDLGPTGSGAGEAHVDGISIQGGQNGVLIQGNAIYGWDTSCLIINNDFGNPSNVRVDSNWLLNESGKQTSYNTYWSHVLGTAEMTNNFMQRGAFGYSSIDTTPQLVWSNNRDYNTNALIALGS